MPIPGTRQLPLPDPSDGFTSAELGLQWAFWHEFDPARFSTGQGVLNLQARGSSLADSSALTTPVGGHSYTVEVDVEITPRLLHRPAALLRSPALDRHPARWRGHRRAPGERLRP